MVHVINFRFNHIGRYIFVFYDESSPRSSYQVSHFSGIVSGFSKFSKGNVWFFVGRSHLKKIQNAFLAHWKARSKIRTRSHTLKDQETP